MTRLLALLVLAFFALPASAANPDDGFVWLDANTKIRLKPIGSAGAAAGGSAPEKAVPEQAKKDKQEKRSKK